MAQDIGVPLGYGFSWYIHGPYSTDLTAVAYQIIPEGKEAIEGITLRAPFSDMVKRVNMLEDELSSKDLKLSKVQWYELVASIAYWYARGYVTDQKIIDRIRDTKPQFTESQTKAAYEAYVAFKK